MSTGTATTRGLWSSVVGRIRACATCSGISFPSREESTSSTVWRAFLPCFAQSLVSTARMLSASLRTFGPLGGQQERCTTCASITSTSCDSGSVGTGRSGISVAKQQRRPRTPTMKACRFGSCCAVAFLFFLHSLEAFAAQPDRFVNEIAYEVSKLALVRGGPLHELDAVGRVVSQTCFPCFVAAYHTRALQDPPRIHHPHRRQATRSHCIRARSAMMALTLLQVARSKRLWALTGHHLQYFKKHGIAPIHRGILRTRWSVRGAKRYIVGNNGD